MVLVLRKALSQLLGLFLLSSLPATGNLVFEAEFSRLIRSLEQELFWFGKTSVSEYYKPGMTIDLIVLKSKASATPLLAFCAPQLQHCLAYLTESSYVASYPIRIDANSSLERASGSYLRYLSRLPALFVPPAVAQNDFHTARGKVVLPQLSLPKQLAASPMPAQLEEAKRVWETNLKPNLSCAPAQQRNSQLVSREFLFARRAVETEWFVARICLYSGGEEIVSVHLLFLGDFQRWQLTSAGYMGTTADNPQVKHVFTSIQRVLLTSFRD